jgi:hypothetical protein
MPKYKGILPKSETKKKTYQSVYSHSKSVNGKNVDYFDVLDTEEESPKVPNRISAIKEMSKWNFLL